MDNFCTFDDIFRDYYTRLYCHAYSFLRDPDNARDVVNDTFELLWKNFARHRGSATVGPYLFSVVRNKCVDILRREAIHKRFIHDRELQGSFRENYDYTDYDARLELIRKQIESLPPQTRNVFVMCYIEGYSYQEAAQKLGISPNTVKTFLSRAMKTLRGIWGRDE